MQKNAEKHRRRIAEEDEIQMQKSDGKIDLKNAGNEGFI
mgnify:CR=1 FL=1